MTGQMWYLHPVLVSTYQVSYSTLSTRSFCTPNLPPNPLAASTWELCFDKSSTWSWPKADYSKKYLIFINKIKYGLNPNILHSFIIYLTLANIR